MKAKIFITPRKAVRHPESETVLTALQEHIGLPNVTVLSIGKYFEIEFNSVSAEEARRQAEALAKRETNPIVQDARIEIESKGRAIFQQEERQ